ncbi:hypothetical protein J3F83DRAFT_562739 [Trichoderma novae-zelandiae]
MTSQGCSLCHQTSLQATNSHLSRQPPPSDLSVRYEYKLLPSRDIASPASCARRCKDSLPARCTRYLQVLAGMGEQRGCSPLRRTWDNNNTNPASPPNWYPNSTNHLLYLLIPELVFLFFSLLPFSSSPFLSLKQPCSLSITLLPFRLFAILVLHPSSLSLSFLPAFLPPLSRSGHAQALRQSRRNIAL